MNDRDIREQTIEQIQELFNCDRFSAHIDILLNVRVDGKTLHLKLEDHDRDFQMIDVMITISIPM